MSTLATWSHVVQSRDVSPHNFDGLAMSGLAFSVAPLIQQLVATAQAVIRRVRCTKEGKSKGIVHHLL